MQETIDQTKATFLRTKGQMAHALATIPDDRINWAPSPTARTPIQQVAHSAVAVKNIQEMLNGHPFHAGGTAEADAEFREQDRQYNTREEVLNLLNEHCDAYVAFLDALTPEQFGSMVEGPFKLGLVPVSVGIAFPAEHMRGHTAQIDYIQTIYGDQDWHL